MSAIRKQVEDISNRNSKIDIDELMQSIRSRVKSSQESSKNKVPGYRTQASIPHKGEFQPPIYSDELNYLNANWANWSGSIPVTSHRKIIGPFIVKFKKKLIDIGWKYLLKDYFERERSFQMNLVRHLNNSARYVDSRIAEVFWDLVKKIDNDVQGLNERTDILHDEALKVVHERVEEPKSVALQASKQVSAIGEELKELDRVTRGLESIVSLVSRESTTGSMEGGSIAPEVKPSSLSLDYLLLENRFRGSEDLIRQRASVYVNYFLDAPKKVLDIGCGRGELLELLKENNVEAEGIDFNSSMIETCKAKGLCATESDALSYLSGLPDNSLGGVIALQVVEHMRPEEVDEMFVQVSRVLCPGARAIFETINPKSVVSLSNNFYRDPTHTAPVHPDTLAFRLSTSGFTDVDIKYSAEFPEDAKLQKIESVTGLPARMLPLVDNVNGIVARLNDLLYGYQDYYVIGRKPL